MEVQHQILVQIADKIGGGNSSSGGNGSSSSNQGSDTNATSNNNQQNNVKFDLERTGVLNNSDGVNWDNIKEEVENLYTSIPTITIDLYKINLNQDDILSFNKEFDNLTLVAKDENKEQTLQELSKIYDYIPKFAKNATNEELYKKLVETKSNIFKAYAKLDSEKWDEISSDISNGVNIYSQLLTDTNIDSQKQYSINRVYIMINELQNAVSLKDKSVFLIKYKNLVEEINNL